MSVYKIQFSSKEQQDVILKMFTFEFEASTTYEYMVILTEYIVTFNLRDLIVTAEIIN